MHLTMCEYNTLSSQDKQEEDISLLAIMSCIDEGNTAALFSD